MYQLSSFSPTDASALAIFLNHLRKNHWSLTSSAYQRKPEPVPLVGEDDLIRDNVKRNRIGTFLLRREDQIISMLQVDDKHGDGRVAVFSGAETLPEFQRRGIFWRSLGIPCIRRLCAKGFDRIDAITWTFNRKGIPVYKRMGFRAVPGTSLVMENYFPLIVRHPSTRSYFDRYDFIQTLHNRRSYGYDAVDLDGLRVFEYQWKSGEERLRVLIDCQRQRIAFVEH